MLETFAIGRFGLGGSPLAENVPEIPPASITVREGTDTQARVSLGPLPKGYADTIGNSLRRVLLSAIKGSAVTAVKIQDVMHEYSAIPGVKEEVMDLLLNIKRIRIRSPLARPGSVGRMGKMRLEVQGPGPVCAGDIITSSDFEIVNPELHLATLDGADIDLFIEFTVETGKKGYQRSDSEDNQGLSVGVLPVDAIFNPVQKVTYHREAARVGDQHDLDNLVLELWTDGTVSPVEALGEAAGILVGEFFKFQNLASGGDYSGQSLSLSPELYQTPIEQLDLSARTLNCLKRARLSRIGEVLEMSDEDLLKIRNFGEKSLEELRTKLTERRNAANAAAESGPDYGAPALEEPPEEIEDEEEEDYEDFGDEDEDFEEDDDDEEEEELVGAAANVASAAGFIGIGGGFAPEFPAAGDYAGGGPTTGGADFEEDEE